MLTCLTNSCSSTTAGSGFKQQFDQLILRNAVFVLLVQILVKLCTFVSPAEELAQKDDLQLLFSAITSWCPPHNLPWRRSAGDVLTTISRHGLSVNVVKYIHGKYRRAAGGGHLFPDHMWMCTFYTV